MSDKDIIDKLIDLTEGTIDHFDREDAMDMLYEVKRLLGKREALEQETFINKSCVSSGVCEHDKNKVLDKIKADLEKLANDEWNTKVGSVSQGLECALEIIEAYQEGR